VFRGLWSARLQQCTILISRVSALTQSEAWCVGITTPQEPEKCASCLRCRMLFCQTTANMLTEHRGKLHSNRKGAANPMWRRQLDDSLKAGWLPCTAKLLFSMQSAYELKVGCCQDLNNIWNSLQPTDITRGECNTYNYCWWHPETTVTCV